MSTPNPTPREKQICVAASIQTWGATEQAHLCEAANKRHRRGQKGIIRDNCRKLIERQ